MTLLTAILARTPLISDPVPIFLSVMAIILVTPLLLNRLKIPHVIGLILAGVAVGPHGFGLLDKDMSFEVFGQVGLFYLMFLAGIEIDMYHLKKNLSKGLVFGLFTFGIPWSSEPSWPYSCLGCNCQKPHCWRLCFRHTHCWPTR